MNLKFYKIIKAFIKTWEDSATVPTVNILQASIATTTSTYIAYGTVRQIYYRTVVIIIKVDRLLL